MGTIFGLNDYMSRVELFYQKIGEFPLGEDNRFSFMGRYFENSIADLFQYWDGDNESIVRNHSSGRKVRDTRCSNFRYINDDFPWISCNIDRFYRDLGTGKRGIIDCKNMMEWVEKKWEAGIPPYHVIQVMTYMGVLKMDHAYVVVLVGGNRLEAYPIDFRPSMFESIVEKSKDFWGRVEAAKKIKAETGATGNELMSILGYMDIEPIGENNSAYEDFLKKKYEFEEGMRVGTDVDLANAYALHDAKVAVKRAQEIETEYRTKIQKAIGPAQGLEFANDKSKVTWIPDKNGSRTVRLYLDHGTR